MIEFFKKKSEWITYSRKEFIYFLNDPSGFKKRENVVEMSMKAEDKLLVLIILFIIHLGYIGSTQKL